MIRYKMRQTKDWTTTKNEDEKMNEEYFRNYCERGKPYSECWRDHSGFDDCIFAIDKLKIKPEIHTVLVLGSADSSILNAFETEGYVAEGIEKFSAIVHPDPRVYVQDFMLEVPKLFRDGLVYDLIFANSLVYLDQHQVIPFLGFCAHFTPYFHCSSSVKGNAAPDPYRNLLKTQKWWDNTFGIAGWNQTKVPFLYESYMFEAR